VIRLQRIPKELIWKAVFVLATIFIVFQIPNVDAQATLKYQYDMYEFSIIPPSDWEVFDYPVSYIEVVSLVEIDDDSSNLNSIIQIKLFKNVKDLKSSQVSSSYLEYLTNALEEECQTASPQIDGFMCTDFLIKEAKSLTINGNKAYKVIYSTKEVYPNITVSLENVVVNIPFDSDIWTVSASTSEEYHNSYEELIEDSINTIKITKLSSPPKNLETKGTVLNSPLSHWKSPQTNVGISLSDFLVFNSFTDLSQRPTNIISPTEFTSQWYTNEKHNFAVKFPKPLDPTWVIKENIDENTIAEFTFPETGAKLRIRYTQNPELSEYLYGLADPKFFSFLLGENKAELYKKLENVIFKNFRSSTGETVLDSVGVTKFSDGLVLFSDFFEKHESGENTRIVLNDITLIALRDGTIYEMLYYGDSYSSLSYNDLSSVTDSIYLGDISKIEHSSGNDENYGLYQNKKFGISYQFPKGWASESIDLKYLKSITMVRFFPDPYDGLISPTITISYEDLGNFINLDDPEHKILNDYLELIQAGYNFADIEVKNISKKIERLDDHVKITLVEQTTLSPHDTPIELKGELVVLIYDNGQSYSLQIATLPDEFDDFKEIFRQTIDSFIVGGNVYSNPYLEEPESSIPKWVRNNADWWAKGAIGDSDFVSGIQYLIKEKIMTIPETAKAAGDEESNEIPSWIKNNADWWAKGLISDDDFVTGIQYLVANGIINVN